MPMSSHIKSHRLVVSQVHGNRTAQKYRTHLQLDFIILIMNILQGPILLQWNTMQYC